MKRLISLFLCVLFTFSLCACQQAAPSSGEAPDQQAITEEATEYFNQMMDGDFETFFNALPQGVQDNTSAAFTPMSFGKMKQNKKERHLYE